MGVNKMQVHSFEPVIDKKSQVLILGSMPGVESLRKQEYYANPRNQFWPIICSILGFEVELSYPDRLERLKSNRVALWDILASCDRDGSSDAKITNGTANDFDKLFHDYKNIRFVFFNGTKAAALFKKHASVELLPDYSVILPSTSPAYTITAEKKAAEWSIIKSCLSYPECGSDTVVPIIYHR
jgi:TDG/mug DNA glycosylase family protein